MKIDKDNLPVGIWYEDEKGEMYPSMENSPECVSKKPMKTYHTCFPFTVTEEIYRLYNNKDTCRHPLKDRKRTHGWIKGIKGCRCQSCGMTKTGKWYVPFKFMQWNEGSPMRHIMDSHYSLSTQSIECAIAMRDSGDYTLAEALAIIAHSCARCTNVLIYKYLTEEDGYAEFSPQWYKANTECMFCKDMDLEEGE